MRAEDAAKYGLIWLKPAPMNNSYGFAMTRKESERLHITKLSQVESLPVKERTFCVESEFANRNDGFEPDAEALRDPAGLRRTAGQHPDARHRRGVRRHRQGGLPVRGDLHVAMDWLVKEGFVSRD
ncbi:glycine betaine ABC transporter substrate-binding protein [Kribbella sp. NPDC050459]|uniref:glycine betaine ABC transporter substrate-binding protein n=1 Tax=Kribbella sp. NPDC050459 TaxID=3155785 RepID=UPI003406AF66